jgi:hypothetical protein
LRVLGADASDSSAMHRRWSKVGEMDAPKVSMWLTSRRKVFQVVIATFVGHVRIMGLKFERLKMPVTSNYIINHKSI